MFFLDDHETEKLSDIIANAKQILASGTLTVAQFKNIRYRTNQIINTIWMEEIEKVYIHDGKFEQFNNTDRSAIFSLKRPTLTNLATFKEKIQKLNIPHPVKARMEEILLDIQEIVDIVESLSKIERLPNDR